MRTWIPKAREKIRVAWAQAVFEDLLDIINSILTHKQASPIDHPDGSVTNEKIADGTIDLLRKCTYVPLNRAGDIMTGTLEMKLPYRQNAVRVGMKGYVGSTTDSPVLTIETDSDYHWAKMMFQAGQFYIRSGTYGSVVFDLPNGDFSIYLPTWNLFFYRFGYIRPLPHNYCDIGTESYRFRNLYLGGHVIIPASSNILARKYDGEAKTVTETDFTLKDEVLPTPPKSVLYPKHVIIGFNNPSDSGVTLDYELALLHSDNDETVAFSRTGISPGSSGSDDLAEEVLVDAFKDGCSVTRIRLYARVSGTPTVGYEPTVTLIKVRGVQF